VQSSRWRRRCERPSDLTVDVGPLLVGGEAAEANKLLESGEVANGLQDLARFRSELRIPKGKGTLARLDAEDRSFYGVNAHGQPTSSK
jgi:hypothetical protein